MALPEDVWLDAAKDAVRNALSTFEDYVDLQFEEIEGASDANFVLRMNSMEEIGATARFGYPDPDDDQAVGQFPFDWGAGRPGTSRLAAMPITRCCTNSATGWAWATRTIPAA